MFDPASFTSDAPILPAGRHFAVTWSLPTEFAGRTNAMLHRSRAFAANGGRPVDILTFDDFRDYSAIRDQLLTEGFLSEGTSVLNLWEDLPALADALDRDADQEYASFSPLATWAGPVVDLEGPHARRARYSEDGTLLQIDHFRSDGSLLVSDRHDARSKGTHGGRSLTLCDSDGIPVRHYGSSWGLYREWLDSLVGETPAWFVVDNKNTARFMSTFRRDTAVVLYVIHESHLESWTEGFASTMTRSAQEVFPLLDRFDGVIYLTEQQASDVHQRYADIGNSFVIPNSRSIAVEPPATARRSAAIGIQAASLNRRKRIDHSIRAVQRVHESLAGTVQLNVFGEGTQREVLEELIKNLAVEDVVRLRGHSKEVRREFDLASFSLLTSTSEAMPLVIVESMAAGCVPIAYDIPYGPASVIDSGVNGFIVEYGNISELADCISAFVTLPEDERASMRVAAIQRAQAFADTAIVPRWAKVMQDVWERKYAPSSPLDVDVVSSDYILEAGGQMKISLLVDLEAPDDRDSVRPDFFCALRPRKQQDFFRVPAVTVVDEGDGRYHLEFTIGDPLLHALAPSTVDFSLEAWRYPDSVSRRIPLFDHGTSRQIYATRHGNLSMVLR